MPQTPYERETIIIMNDEVDYALVTTYQRTVINALRKNPAAVEQDKERMARHGGASFKLPAKLVNLRMPRKAGAGRPRDPKADADRMAKARAARTK